MNSRWYVKSDCLWPTKVKKTSLQSHESGYRDGKFDGGVVYQTFQVLQQPSHNKSQKQMSSKKQIMYTTARSEMSLFVKWKQILLHQSDEKYSVHVNVMLNDYCRWK